LFSFWIHVTEVEAEAEAEAAAASTAEGRLARFSTYVTKLGILAGNTPTSQNDGHSLASQTHIDTLFAKHD